MFASTEIQAATRRDFYAALADQARHLVDGEPDDIANLANVSALLNELLADINWVGFYLFHEVDNALVLGPFQGRPACIRIALGKGVCGTAAQSRSAQVVPDVFAFPGHIACDAASRAEVVVPIVQDDRLIGVLDIDSPNPGRFDDEDAAGLQSVVDVLIEHIRFPHR